MSIALLGRSFLSAVLAYSVLLVQPLSVAGAAQSATVTAAATTPVPAAPAPPEADSADGTFSKEQLEQLVAPIALYSDGLLAQILMASTYPIEVVEAERFMTANPKLAGTELDEKLKDQDWDPAVKSMCSIPETLKKMSDNLDWTQDLGDAYLGQKDELMDTVQQMRNKAYDGGNLKTTEQQVIKVEEQVEGAPKESADKIIIIESPNPEVVYVPQYAPTSVYPGWSYPYWYYPPMYPYYPYGAGFVAFGAGILVGAAIWGGCRWGWGRGDIDIDIDRHNNFDRNTNRDANRGDRAGDRGGQRGGKQSFQHDASHRKGANYKNSSVASKHGAGKGSNRVSSSQTARGKSGGAQAGQTRTGSGSGNRASQAGSGNRASAGTQNRSSSAGSSSRGSSYSGSRGSAYSGSSSPSTSKYSSSRGAYSRGSTSYGGRSYGGGYGGGYRGGGGGRGGGGRRR